jgi:hypothetical protein
MIGVEFRNAQKSLKRKTEEYRERRKVKQPSLRSSKQFATYSASLLPPYGPAFHCGSTCGLG